MNGNGASVDELRAARLTLAARIREGADYLRPIFDEVEDALIDRLARAHREPADNGGAR
jgi:hypothetical protein